MYDRVVTINNTHWPAYRKPGAILVDLRMFDSNDRSLEARLVFRQRSCANWEYQAHSSRPLQNLIPQGFLLFDDLPNQTQQASGRADQATTKT